jgi:hypothetical protein
VNDGLRALDSVKAQIANIEAVAKDRLPEVPAELAKAIDEYKKKHDALMKTLATDDEDGIRAPSQFADQLGGLYFTVSSGNVAPTPTMRENYELLRAEHPKRIAEINQFLTADTAKMNETLTKFGLGIIVSGKQVETAK